MGLYAAVSAVTFQVAFQVERSPWLHTRGEMQYVAVPPFPALTFHTPYVVSTTPGSTVPVSADVNAPVGAPRSTLRWVRTARALAHGRCRASPSPRHPRFRDIEAPRPEAGHGERNVPGTTASVEDGPSRIDGADCAVRRPGGHGAPERHRPAQQSRMTPVVVSLATAWGVVACRRQGHRHARALLRGARGHHDRGVCRSGEDGVAARDARPRTATSDRSTRQLTAIGLFAATSAARLNVAENEARSPCLMTDGDTQ